MDRGQEHVQTAHTRLVQINDVHAQEIDHPVVEEDRFSIRPEPPEVTGNHVHQLRELSFAITQSFFSPLLIFDVDHGAVPAALAVLVVSDRSQSKRPEPAINAIRSTKPIL